MIKGVERIDMDFPWDMKLLKKEADTIIDKHGRFSNFTQVSLCTADSNINDWVRSTGQATEDRSIYKHINPVIKNFELAKIINYFPEYFAWRLLRLHPKTNYTIHKDKMLNAEYSKVNYRIHIPITTTPESLFLFFPNPADYTQDVEVHTMQEGNVYKFDANLMHTAINGNIDQSRTHLIGEKYVE